MIWPQAQQFHTRREHYQHVIQSSPAVAHPNSGCRNTTAEAAYCTAASPNASVDRRPSRTTNYGALVETSGGSRWQPHAHRHRGATPNVPANRCFRLPAAAADSAW